MARHEHAPDLLHALDARVRRLMDQIGQGAAVRGNRGVPVEFTLAVAELAQLRAEIARLAASIAISDALIPATASVPLQLPAADGTRAPRPGGRHGKTDPDSRHLRSVGSADAVARVAVRKIAAVTGS